MDLPLRATGRKSHRRNFASLGSIILFLLMVLIVLFIFFPSDEMIMAFRKAKTPDLVTQRYLVNLLETYPHNIQLKLILARQEIAMGEIERVKRLLRSIAEEDNSAQVALEKRWLEYSILRTQTFAEKPGSLARQKSDELMRKKIAGFLNEPLNDKDLNALSIDALSLDLPELASQFNLQISREYPHQTKAWYANAGKVALMAEHYKQSARYYFIAQKLSKDIEEERQYYIAAIKSLLARGDTNYALEQAEAQLGLLSADQYTLELLAQLAIKANHPAVAQKYVNKALWLRHIKQTQQLVKNEKD